MNYWLERKRESLREMIRRYGTAYVFAHRAALEREWQVVADLEGFDPVTGNPIPRETT